MQERDDRQRAWRRVRLVVSALILGLVLASCAALALIPITAAVSGRPETGSAFQALFAALFALLGLLMLLTERQLRQRGWSRAPVSFVTLLFTTPSGLTFWTGLALFGLALAGLEAPAYAGPLNIAFWALAGFWLLIELALNARHLLRPGRAHAPGRDDGEAPPAGGW
jgi:hypothetical protein